MKRQFNKIKYSQPEPQHATTETATKAVSPLSLAAIDLNGNISTIPLSAIISTGQISYFAFPGGSTGENVPTGYLVCDGSLLSRITYINLFTAIGTNFGSGDGTSTFNIPDLRGIFIRGYDSRPVSSGNDPCDNITGVSTPPSSTTTRGFGSNQTDAFQNITGTAQGVYFVDDANNSFLSFRGSLANSIRRRYYQVNITTGSYGGVSGDVEFDASKSNGARTSVETRPKNVTMLACIRYF
jgi:phage-related tail fiber protein